MTEEEIRPIAEDYVEEYCHCPDGEYTDGSLVCAGIGTALIVSRQLEKRIAELEKENAELEKQIIKMKNCQNCDNEGEDYHGNACCKINKSAWNCDKWEIRK